MQTWTARKPEGVQLDPTLCIIYGAGMATPEAVAREMTRLGGTAAFFSTLDRLAVEHLSSGEPWISGTCWALSYITDKTTDGSFPDLWKPFKETGGNMMTVLGNNFNNISANITEC